MNLVKFRTRIEFILLLYLKCSV